MSNRKKCLGGILAVLWVPLLLGGCTKAGAGSSGGYSSSAYGVTGGQAASSAAQTGASGAPAAGGETGPFLHFSCDDVLDVFADLTVNEDVYQSAFENPMLGWLRALHEDYGVVTTLYCFYENHDATFSLADVTDRFAQEFAQNTHWLRFAMHARNINTTYETADPAAAAQDYTQCTTELMRIAGGEGSVDRTVRLHWFRASQQVLAALRDAPVGIGGLLAGVNENDANYYLDEAQQQAMFSQGLWQNDGLFFTPTDLWLEDIPETEWPDRLQSLARGGPAAKALVAFTHEYMMQDEALLQRITETAQYAQQNGYRFCFLQEGLFGANA